VYHDATVFGFGAWNPQGSHMTLEWNMAADARLEQELQRLSAPAPAARWRGFCFSFEENYRENGHLVAFAKADAAAGRQTILALGRKFNQGAVYEYVVGDDGRFRRLLVPCDGSDRVDTEFVRRVHPPEHEFTQAEWPRK
jgi:hypothetical protein